MSLARVVAMLLVARAAAADVELPTKTGALVPVPLDSMGWAVEARIEIGSRDTSATMDITDDRRSVHIDISHGFVSLEGEPFLVELAGSHVVRVEAAGSRKLLLLDGSVVVDHDYGLPDMVLDKPTGVALSPGKWERVTADAAPQGLAHSSNAYVPATHFSGPLGPWMMAWAQREHHRRAELAAITLPEAARWCAAFAIVAAVAKSPRPVHFRLGELKTAPPESARPAIPEPIDFEMPRVHAVPMRRLSRDYALVAQDELRKALTQKQPAGRLQRAVDSAVSATLPEDATDYLLAQLAVLAKRPGACR